MRCLSLATAFVSAGSRVAFAASAETFKSVAVLADSPYEKLIVSGMPAEEARQIGDKWAAEKPLVIADHYERDLEFERPCRAFASAIAVIDDIANRKHEADALFDSGAVSGKGYEALVPPECRIYAGPSYAIVHPDFLIAREAALPRRDGRPVARILVAFGQTDPGNATALALDGIEAAGFNGAVDVVLGQSAPHLAAIRRRAKGKVTLHVNATNMPALIATCDLGIGAGGVSSLERCCLGLPSVVVEIADNQHMQVKMLAEAGAIAAAGKQAEITSSAFAEILRDLLADSAKRKHMAAASTMLVDGRGVERIVIAATQ